MPSLTLPSSLWETVKCDFKGLFPEDVFQMWFEPVVCLETTEDAMTLGVPNDFAAIWIHDNYLDLITQRLRLTAGRLINVSLESLPWQHRRPLRQHPPDPSQRQRRRRRLRPHHNRLRAPPRRTGRFDEKGPYAGSLNPRNTFENFVVGANNQLAHAAALAVAQAPAQAFNPLFIYGDTGLGKTHLMHAVGHSILRNNPDAKVAYLSTEKFTNEFIQALQENSLTRFRQRYRNVDVLLLDDVQFLSGKERIQEEFFHTFNDVFESGKQVVLSSDRPASEIAKLESRLVSRFQWGYVADIQSPDFETRVAILRTKAACLKFDVPPAVINFLAQHISKNIRRLEGALIKVASYSALTNKPLDLPTVEVLLQDVLMEQAQNQLTLGDDPEARRRPLPDPPQRHDQQAPAGQHRPAPADRHVSRPPAHQAFPAGDRRRFWRPRSRHRDPRLQDGREHDGTG